MSCLRIDAHSGDVVSISPGRSGRPGAARLSPVLAVRPRPDAPPCPFCGGHEDRTPPEVLALGRAPDTPADTAGWTVRVVPNLYPALGAGDGAHEVAVHGPVHRVRLAELDDGVLPAIAAAWCARARAHAAAGRPAVVVGVNEGRAAGASLEHSHSQIVALPQPPPRLAVELQRAGEGADVLDTPVVGSRVVAREHGLVAFAPHAPRIGDELRIAPEEPLPDAFADPDALAAALRLATRALDRALGPAPLNVVVHSRPAGVETPYRWHLEVLPRVAVQALLELGAGIMVCHADPDESASRYRTALLV